jgi:quercetin dioxygenase-like cupin family protein
VSAEPVVEPYPGVRRTSVRGKKATVALYEFEPGAQFPLHRHVQEQITIVVDGSIDVTAGDETMVLSTGEAFVTEPKEPHGITARETGARFIAVIAPARTSDDDLEVVDSAALS